MALPSAGDSSGSHLRFLRETVEPFTKVGAVVVALTYVAGFVVVNLHHGHLGLELSLLKARVVAAGVLFGVLTLIPVVFLTRIHGSFAPRPTSALPNGTNDDGPIGTLIRRLELYPQCVALALPFIMLFEQGGSEKTGTPWGTGLVFISCSLLATSRAGLLLSVRAHACTWLWWALGCWALCGCWRVGHYLLSGLFCHFGLVLRLCPRCFGNQGHVAAARGIEDGRLGTNGRDCSGRSCAVFGDHLRQC